MSEKPGVKIMDSPIVKILGVIICLVLIPILIINLTLIVKSFVYPDKVPDFFGYKPFIVLSGSMEPEFFAGDLVIVREEPAESLAEGDIISFRQGGAVITHRIQKINLQDGQRIYTTKGDNNNVEDNFTVTDNMIEGVYIYKISGLGNGAIFMQTPLGMILFIALPLILFILYDFLRRRYYERRKKKLTAELQAELERMKQQLARTEDTNNENNNKEIINKEND